MLWDAGKEGSAADTTADTPEDAYFPEGQETHVADEFAPAALEYVPAAQEAHVADEFAPAALEYVPAVQEAHVVAPASAEPGRAWSVSGQVKRPAGRQEERQQQSSSTATV